MKLHVLTFLLAAMMVPATANRLLAEMHQLTKADKIPDGLSKQIAAQLQDSGHQIAGPEGPVAEIWLAKSVPVKSGFAPTLNIKYPFTPGQLIGVLRVEEGAEFTDFRGQELSPGVYTLRYGQQPQDGNHIGTSELSDFLLAIPAKNDTDPKPITGFDQLSGASAKSAGSTHPAIFSLLPAEDEIKSPTLTHDEDREFWILNVVTAGKAGDKETKVPMRIVAIGRSAV